MPGRILSFVSAKGIKSSLQHATQKLDKAQSPSSPPSDKKPRKPEKPDRDTMDLLKRHSVSLGKHLHNTAEQRKGASAKSSPAQDAYRPAKLELIVESPPLVSYGPPSLSSGALFSGQLRLSVLEKSVTFESISVQLLRSVTLKKPVGKDCPVCTSDTEELKKWTFAKEPLALEKGEHKFPVSYLFKGDMPASTHAYLTMLDYHISAVAVTSTGETIKFGQTLELSRAIPPGTDKQSIRVFPPTNITAHVTLNPTVHQIGEFNVSMRLDGMTTKQKDAQIRWRLRRVNWRIEEHQKMYSPACPKHLAKAEGKQGINHTETRTIGEHEVNYQKTPWKSNVIAGEVDCEFTCAVNASKKPVCDVVSTHIGLSISHILVLELVVAEEWAQNKRLHHASPTGAARILRTQFPLLLTKRAGLGIAWDEETPPVYEDVPCSPPGYIANTAVEDFDLAELDGIADLNLGEPHDQARTSGAMTSASTIAGRPPSFEESVASAALISGRPSSSEGVLAGPSRSGPRFSVDDLLHEPPEFRSSRTLQEEDEPMT